MVLISIGDNISQDVRELVIRHAETEPNFRIFQAKECSWASFINAAIDEAFEEGFKFFFKSHDDIEVLSQSFWPFLLEVVEGASSPIGWVSFTDNGWREGNVSYSTRPGWHIDARDSRLGCNMFQFHKFPNDWYRADLLDRTIHRFVTKFRKIEQPYPKPIKRLRNYELCMPVAPCRVHAPYNYFVAISDVSLSKIGPCKDWGTKNALLVDEDWGLRANEIGMKNIWIPHLFYRHEMEGAEGGRSRSFKEISANATRVHNLFFKDWGFHPTPTDNELETIRLTHSEETLAWNINRNSFDWLYDI